MMRVAIAGAGLAGRLAAWRLRRRGCAVTLFDTLSRDDARTPSMVAAAMLSPLAELAASDLAVYELGCRSMALWPAWLAELREDSGCEVYHRREGTLVVAHAADRASLVQFERRLRHKLPAARGDDLQSVDVADVEPALGKRFERGLLLRGEGQLANDELMAALAQALDRLPHAQLVDARVDPRALAADAVIDTRGLGARAAWPALRGVRGEVLTVECAGVRLQRPVRLMHPRYQLYIAPRPRQRFVVGATELESEDDGPVTLRSLLELGSALHSLQPAFGEARVLHAAAALRPALDDHRPALRRHGRLWQLNGLYRHGFLCAPALVDQLVNEVLP